jgi:hypothetical protein
MKDRFYEELERVFDKFPTYHMIILVGDFNAKVGREYIFKPRIGNENLPHVCDVFLMLLMFVLTLANGFCCAWFIYPKLCWCCYLEIGTSSIVCAQLSRFHLRTETEYSLQNIVHFN